MLDAHTHTQFAAFAADRQEVIRRALNAGVALINVGTQVDTSRKAIEVAHELENQPVYATVGLHPTHTEKSYHDAQELGLPDGTQKSALHGFVSRGEEFDPKVYLEMVADPKVVAIGECGLDYYRLQSTDDRSQITETKERQKKIFLQHVEIARTVNKPLMIHCRPSKGTDDAYEDILNIISNYQFPITKISHFFVGSPGITKKMIDAGFNFTFGGVITFSRDYDESIRLIPDDRILVETDAPYVAPQGKRGKRNEPAYVIEVAQKMAEIRGVSYNRIEEIIKENALRIFGINV